MSKCKRCGANVIRSVALADGALCYKCFDELGFDKNSRKHYSTAAYDEIKDGYSVYIRNLIDQRSETNKEIAQKLGFSFAHYGEEREVNETDEEAQIFDVIRSMVSDPDGQLRLVRKSDSYVTAAVGEWDLARFKYTDRAKWIMFPTVEAKAQKHYIEDPEEVYSFADLLADSIAHIAKYSN